MKYLGLRNQIKQLRAQLPSRGLTITISGGIPEDYNTAKPPEPPGIELQSQAAAFRRPKTAAKTPAAAAAPFAGELKPPEVDLPPAAKKRPAAF